MNHLGDIVFMNLLTIEELFESEYSKQIVVQADPEDVDLDC
jgi:hypothetical protein